jgi:hypothetical protein
MEISLCRLCALPTSRRLTVTKTPAYNDTEVITDLESSTINISRPNLVKNGVNLRTLFGKLDCFVIVQYFSNITSGLAYKKDE